MINFGFKQRVIAVAALLLVLSLSVSLYISYYFLAQDKQQSIDYSASLKTDAVSNSIETWMSNVSRTLQNVAPTFATEYSEEDTQLLLKQVADSSQVFAIVVGFENGSAFSSRSGKYDSNSYDPRVRGWYKQAKAKRSTVITGIYRGSSTKKLMVSVAEPFYEGTALKGVLLADLTLEIMNERINDNLPEGAIASLFDSQGTVIASSSPKSTAGETNLSDIASLAPHKTTVLSSGYGSFVFDSAGRNRIGYHDEVHLGYGVSWYYLVSVDQAKAYQSLSDLVFNMVLVAAGLIILSVLGIMLTLQMLFKPMNRLQSKVDDLTNGDGDLTKSIDVTNEDEIGKVAISINALMSQLQNLISDTKSLGKDISTSMTASAEGANKAQSFIADQMQEVDQLAAAIDEMSVSAKEVANHSQQASTAIQSANGNIEKSAILVEDSAQSTDALSQKVQEAVSVVTELNQATKRIESVLEVINDIADQTNLLALNAAIEAARAGASGRGFAVVADEVRTLAQRTQASTEEIGTMIDELQAGSKSALVVMESSQKEVVQTLQHSQDADSALQAIRQAMGQITDMIHQIASAAEQQSIVSEEVNRNAQKTKDISVDVSDFMGNLTGSISEQQKVVEEQDKLLSRFKV
ncbi:methyl-accepting chemotaxis protein [Vibrio nigripulchritudo ATCC 27043]|uniref:methyl-accepting chemotaxis protein n=1 Tax=Vibrio nigripulchritudo TaxID=28173 RepID=UPI00021C2667|nr:methyl-accepting chemotaxis protein [Vibrio nigripulchritudo]EGU58894.1 methyl-accepting chemotaxis protein [Vibrio nigripulchritudo ATCC 27043]